MSSKNIRWFDCTLRYGFGGQLDGGRELRSEKETFTCASIEDAKEVATAHLVLRVAELLTRIKVDKGTLWEVELDKKIKYLTHPTLTVKENIKKGKGKEYLFSLKRDYRKVGAVSYTGKLLKSKIGINCWS